MAVTAATVTAGAAVVGATAATATALGGMSDKAAAKKLRQQQADDILG